MSEERFELTGEECAAIEARQAEGCAEDWEPEEVGIDG